MVGNGRRLTNEQRAPMIGRARRMRALGWSTPAIGVELGVSDRTAWLWTVGVVRGSGQVPPDESAMRNDKDKREQPRPVQPAQEPQERPAPEPGTEQRRAPVDPADGSYAG